MTTTPESTATSDQPVTPTPADLTTASATPVPVSPVPVAVAGPAATSASWTASDWVGKVIVDSEGERIGKLHDVYVDVETDIPKFGTVKEGLFRRHLTFVPLDGVEIGPDELRVSVRKEQVRSAPDLDLAGEELTQEDESVLYHHFEMNYVAIANDSGRRLARR